MTLYRADPADGVAWVTGASSGLGRQVALQLAADGYTVAATARDADKLDILVREAARSGHTIKAFPCDVADEAAMRETAAQIRQQAGPIALAIFNAGIYLPTRLDGLDAGHFAKTHRVNFLGVINGLPPVLDQMRRRSCGHVVVVGSASSFFGLPAAAAYGASKAALNNMVWALKYDLDPVNIRIQIINPGFVDTPLTEKNNFTMPALMSVESAARRLVAAIRSGGTEVSFPRRFTWFLKAIALLPSPLAYTITRRFTGWHKRKPTPPPAD